MLWNGESDKRILNKLTIKDYPILNIKGYDKFFNQTYYIQLIKMKTKQILFEMVISVINKTGRLLNLEETHGVICQKNHKITHAHDPKTDVRLIKSIFDYVIRKVDYGKLIAHF